MSPPTLIASGLSFIICFDIFYCIYIQSFLSTLILHTVTVSDIVIFNSSVNIYASVWRCMIFSWCLISFILNKWTFISYRRQHRQLYLSPLCPRYVLHPFCFPSCECGRYWSVEAYNDARRNARAWALDENLFRVCECHPIQFCFIYLFFPFLLHCPSSLLPLCCPGSLFYDLVSMLLPLNCTCFALNTLLLSHLSTVLWFLLLSSMYYDFFQSPADNFNVTVKTLVPNWTTVFVIIWI